MPKSTPSEPDPEAKPIFELSNKFKCLRHFDQSVGFLGFFFVSICVICGFFYLDYSRAAAERFLFPGHSDRFMSKGANKDKEVEFFGEKGGECDLFEGNWVWDENYPLYLSKDCSLLDNGFRCSEDGRPDLSYTKWRWQPKDCNMPRFLLRCFMLIFHCFTVWLLSKQIRETRKNMWCENFSIFRAWEMRIVHLRLDPFQMEIQLDRYSVTLKWGLFIFYDLIKQ